MGETKAKLLDQQRAVEAAEIAIWRDKFLAAALGSEATSCIGQMLVAHKQAYDKALDRQQKARHSLLKAHKEASVALEATFRIAVWQLRNTTKKQAAMQEAAMQAAGPSPDTHAEGRSDVEDAKSSARTASVDLPPPGAAERGRPGTPVAPTAAGSIGEGLRHEGTSVWSADDGLTAWAWYNQKQVVLRALTELQPRGMSSTVLLRPLLEHVGEWGGSAFRQRLQWVLQVGEIMRRDESDPSRDDAACEIYELLNHTVVPAGFQMEVVFQTLLDNAASCRADLEPAFVAFLGTAACSELMKSLRSLSSGNAELDCVRGMAELCDVPLTNISRYGLLGTLDRLSIRQAVSVVDVTVPGLPLVFVNEVCPLGLGG